MNSVSISQLKMNPSAIFAAAQDYPVAVDSRNKTTGYVVGSKLFERMVEFMEDMEDIAIVKKSEYPKGKKVEDLRAELGL
jgi:antitoxin StbD